MQLTHIFYLQIRESPAPLNIPTPTPAPDWGGPVACLGSPVARNSSDPQNQQSLLGEVCGSTINVLLLESEDDQSILIKALSCQPPFVFPQPTLTQEIYTWC